MMAFLEMNLRSFCPSCQIMHEQPTYIDHFVCFQVYYILARCPYYKENEVDKEKTGIKRLINNGTYTAAFPLHDVRKTQNSLTY